MVSDNYSLVTNYHIWVVVLILVVMEYGLRPWENHSPSHGCIGS